ncbi:phosducin-like protein, putative [Babesia caballi]|uniref:Phosducin-like protein, putative n=1 Tax=Babesia caballi TaxID=5871 RepID=A0AAV4M0N5_BABCB|nr:phosducin-like protein, putative [Babesia caballi]GIX65646.1 phosducin-like protein, putative [Babesia caballi]
MTGLQRKAALVRQVHDNVLSALLEKEREVEVELHQLRQVETKISHLHDDDTLERFRESRLQKLKQMHVKRLEFLNNGFGRLVDVDSDAHFFDVCRNTQYVVAHFYRPTTTRCQYVDGKMHELRQTYFTTKFIRVNAERTPFLCERFNIWCIPTVRSMQQRHTTRQIMIIVDGKTNHSIVGLDELGGDGFTVDEFARILNKHGITPPDADAAH